MSQQYPQTQTQLNQGPSGGPVQGPPTGSAAPKPPKKPFFKRTWVIVTGSIIGVFLIIGIANGGGNTNTASTTTGANTSAPATTAPATKPNAGVKPTKAPATTKAPAATQAPENTACDGSRNDPCPVKLGVAFTVGKHKMEKGWKLKTEDYLGTKLVGKLTNVSGDPSTAFFTVRFLKGNNLVANFQCTSSSELQPAQSEDIECINMSDVQKNLKTGSYDKITAQADF